MELKVSICPYLRILVLTYDSLILYYCCPPISGKVSVSVWSLTHHSTPIGVAWKKAPHLLEATWEGWYRWGAELKKEVDDGKNKWWYHGRSKALKELWENVGPHCVEKSCNVVFLSITKIFWRNGGRGCRQASRNETKVRILLFCYRSQQKWNVCFTYPFQLIFQN